MSEENNQQNTLLETEKDKESSSTKDAVDAKLEAERDSGMGTKKSRRDKVLCLISVLACIAFVAGLVFVFACVFPKTFAEKKVPKTCAFKLYKSYSNNYFVNTDFATLNKSIRPRYKTEKENDKAYSLKIDSYESYGGFNSLKINCKEIGTRDTDILFSTQTNDSTVNSTMYSGDYKKMLLTFYAKTDTPKMQLNVRWGYGDSFDPVTLTSEWTKYTVRVDKYSYDGSTMCMYFDLKGTVWLNRVQLVDGTEELDFEAEKDDSIQKIAGAVGDSYSLPSPKREGYEFVGWYTSKIGGEHVKSQGHFVSSKTKKLYARWESTEEQD